MIFCPANILVLLGPLSRYRGKKQVKGRSAANVRKTHQAVGAVLEEVAPNQSSQLWQSFVESNPYPRDTKKKGDDFDTALIKALTEFYQNASTWRIRRQILSIMADNFTFSVLKAWIPELTRYRFNAARKHALLHGIGVLPP